MILQIFCIGESSSSMLEFINVGQVFIEKDF